MRSRTGGRRFGPVLVTVFLTLVGCSAVNATARRHSYSGYKLYSVEQNTQQQVDMLRDLQQAVDDLDFWKLDRLVGSDARILVPPSQLLSFQLLLDTQQLRYREIIPDFGSVQDEHLFSAKQMLRSKRLPLTKYLRYNEMVDYINSLARKYSDLMTVSEIGKSHEGRPIPSVTIRSPTSYASQAARNNSQPVVFVDAGIHAREWAAPAMAMYLISELVENSAQHKDLLAGLTWIIVPIVNPDGYEYSHERERLWRKTRRPAGRNCYGIDGNRNYDFHWAEVGASDLPCAETYHGEQSFSEPETRAIRDELLRLKGRCKFYLSLHTYGEYLLYPWGWTPELPVGWVKIDKVAKAGARAIHDATGTTYTVGSSTNVLYAAAGGSDDYAFAVADVPISITMELPGGGSAGFNPPPSRIEEIVKETFVGIRAMALEVRLLRLSRLNGSRACCKMSLDSTKLFQTYQSHKDIKQYLEQLVQRYSSKIEIFSRAESYEGREILTVRICTDVQKKRPVPNRWCILIDAGIHAREWITVSVALFIVQQLLEKDEISAKSFRSFEWIILPLLNPDGYEYSREHNKMWRKTRRPLGLRNHHRSCVGVDCNRNFNVAWTIGSTRFCSFLYRGERPFSERETKNVRDLFRKLRPACKFYLSLHSYAKAIIYPRAYTRTLPRNWQMQHTIAEAGADAMKKATGVRYRCGSASTVLNRPVGGSSIDYAHDIEKVPVALVMEVASKGFHPPEANIQRICEESWIGIGAMVNCLAASFRPVLRGSGTLHLR
uniref:Peptidase M14 domain-containing protein n=1 Tax=Anopheles minimus TaxID=112268 RepID=A0A182WLP9_9DIPT